MLLSDRPAPLACGERGDVVVVIDKNAEKIAVSAICSNRKDTVFQQIPKDCLESSDYVRVGRLTRTTANRLGVKEAEGRICY